MNTYSRILKLLPPYKGHFFMAVLCMVGFALANGAMAYLIGPMMKFLFAASGGGADINVLPFGLATVPKEKMVQFIPLVLIAVAALKGFSAYGQTFFMGYIGQGIVRDLRNRLYSHILSLPVSYFASTPTGTLSSRVTHDIHLIQSCTADAVAQFLKQSLTIIVLGAIVVSLDWKLALAAGIALPLSVYPMRKLGQKMKKVSRQNQMTMGAITAILHESLSGIRVVKAFGTEGFESGRFQKESENYMRSQVKSIRVHSISSPLMETIGAIAFAITIWYAAYRINHGTLAPEAFISFFASVLMFYQPIKAINGVNLNIQQGIAAAQRVFEILDMPGEPDSNGRPLDGVNDSIEFRDVSFRYGDDWVLRGLSLNVKRGEIIALVGSSGAGKSTFVNLIPRFYEVTEGSITIDGRELKDIQLASLRSKIAIVSQQVTLFNDTVRNNIAYGGAEVASEEKLMEAARAANAHDFIMRLPQGYETIIGESGVKLSGGERQRISIARALLKDAPILILDEATSALDSESEFEVQKALSNLMKGRTTFVIAHRLSTIRNADRIIVLSEGQIKETGGHDELLQSGGEYSRLYAIQFRG